MKRKFNTVANYSERYTGILTETTPEGNSVQNVCEIIRKASGLLSEERLPFDESIQSWEQYYSPKPMAGELLAEGKKWLEEWVLKHEWVFYPWTPPEEKPKLLMQVLRYSPIGISVAAWPKPDEAGFYHKQGQDNHFTMLNGYEEGKFWKIWDSYDATKKKLAFDYDFGFAKRFYIERKSPELNPCQRYLAAFRGYIHEIIR